MVEKLSQADLTRVTVGLDGWIKQANEAGRLVVVEEVGWGGIAGGDR